MSAPSENKSAKLYKALRWRGYPDEFCREISERYLNTDYTAGKMLGFLANMSDHPDLRPEVIVDEMYAILSDRENYVQKKIVEHNQTKLNRFMRGGLDEEFYEEDE
ncbi:MAG: hypothetical protein SPJ45_01510 [Anaerovoracaceae bacterium]|nr:hypothetical protein [Bacillota bacterium]MDD7733646.1 hypothetical protein [Bacillota bacterium]MDY5905545.1 hypothetical protein [Anaerovoracaceae bacterium]